MAIKIPAYRRQKSRNLAVVLINGKDQYLGPYNSPESREKYHRLVAEMLAVRKSAPSADPPSPPSVATVIIAFWEHAQKHYRHPDGSTTDELGNFKGALRVLRKLYGTTPASEFGPLALVAVREEMVRSGLARPTVNARVNRIRRAFKWAAAREMVRVSVYEALKTVDGLQEGRTKAREPDPIEPVPVEAVEATLAHLAGPPADMVRLQLLTGMRPGEVRMIRGRDITVGDDVWVYRPPSHKTAWRGKGRPIVLGPKAIELVKGLLKPELGAFLFDPRESVAAYHSARSEARSSRPTPSEEAKRAVCPGSGHSKGYSKSSYLNAVTRACDRAFPHPTIRKPRGKPLSPEDSAMLHAWKAEHRWHPNQLRHTAATLIRARFGLEAAQVVLGHAKADTTEIYALRDLAKAAEVMREIG